MSYDDYANHIYQKHRLAVALAIIKSKPSNITTNKYLEELKSKFDHKMDDDDVTVCSDDFLIEDDDMNDSVTILKDFDPGNVIDDEIFKDFDGNAASEKPPNLPENLSQITYYDSSQTQSTSNTAKPLTNDILVCEENYNLNQKLDMEKSIPKNVVRKEFNDEIRNSNHNIDKKSTDVTYSNELDAETLDPKLVANTPNENMDLTYYDSQKTLLYTVHGFTQNYTHYSASQDDIVLPDKYIYGVHNKDLSDENNTTAANINAFENETQFVSKGNSLNCTLEKATNNKEFEYIQSMNMFTQNNDINLDNIHNKNDESNRTMSDINIIINKDTENIIGTQSSTQYSQYFEDMQNIEDSTENIMNDNRHDNPEISDMKITDKSFGYRQNNDYFKSQNKDINRSKNKNEFEKVDDANQLNNDDTKNRTQDSENESSSANKGMIKEHKITEEELDSEEIISYKVLEEFNKVKTFLNRNNRRMSSDGYSTDSGYRSDTQIRNSNRSALQLSGNWLNQSGCCLFNYIMQCPLVASTRDITNEIAQVQQSQMLLSTEEFHCLSPKLFTKLIWDHFGTVLFQIKNYPYRVNIYENKEYLNRPHFKEGVLSRLINRLHEEEKYPSFLEALLETVDSLLRQVYEGDSSEDSEFLKKDENIQRLLLLNKSVHIQKHTIEKISNVLEIFHSNITKLDSTYELSNIEQIENVSYIFHILEILLKKYLKNRELLSQCSTQNSQDDEKVLKKSSISEIWRKKWNPSQTIFEGSREKKCVLKICSDILNKIVVDCVSSYSLVAYSALKCFNSMQS